MMMSYFLVFEVSPSLGGSVDFLVSWEVVQDLGFNDWREKHHKSHLWAWNPRLGFFTHCDLGKNNEHFLTCHG